MLSNLLPELRLVLNNQFYLFMQTIVLSLNKIGV